MNFCTSKSTSSNLFYKCIYMSEKYHMYQDIHYSIICNSKRLETTQMSTNREVVEYIMVYEIKLHFIASQEKNQTQKIFSVLWPPLSCHCALCICIRHRPDLSICRNTCSTIQSNILLVPTRQFLKR